MRFLDGVSKCKVNVEFDGEDEEFYNNYIFIYNEGIKSFGGPAFKRRTYVEKYKDLYKLSVGESPILNTGEIILSLNDKTDHIGHCFILLFNNIEVKFSRTLFEWEK